MTTIVYVGPTLSVDEVRSLLPDATICPPAGHADLTNDLRRWSVESVVLIDGVFGARPAVWHKEILAALAAGVQMYGAASMGALRAAECAEFGMVGVGDVYAGYRSGELTRDDEVAVVHADAAHGFRPQSVPLVNIRATLANGVSHGLISAELAKTLTTTAASWYYPDRQWARLLAETPPEQAARVAQVVREQAVDVKADDARAALRMLSHAEPEPATAMGNAPAWTFAPTANHAALIARNRRYHDGDVWVSAESIAKHGLVTDPAATALVDRGLTRMALVALAELLGITVGESDVASARGRWSARQGWSSPTEAANFRLANQLTEPELAELIYQDAVARRVLDYLLAQRVRSGVADLLIAEYQRRGQFREHLQAGVLVQRLFGEPDGQPPADPQPPLIGPGRILRQQSEQTGWEVPDDLARWADRYGFAGTSAVIAAVVRSSTARRIEQLAQRRASAMERGSDD